MKYIYTEKRELFIIILSFMTYSLCYLPAFHYMIKNEKKLSNVFNLLNSLIFSTQL